MEQNNIIVAIDGYSACGKSTVAKALARKTKFLYIDSGAMYRAVTLHFMNNNTNIDDLNAVRNSLTQISVELDFQNNKTVVLLNNEDVSEKIREREISRYVPSVSAIKEVRVELTSTQRRIGKNRNIIMDGRDIGTVVFPEAHVKIFMTADPLVRAERRFKELILKNPEITIENVLDELNQRDFDDLNRNESPLVQADDAIVLDNSKLDQTQQLDFIMTRLNRLPARTTTQNF